ncbi:MAG TPA: glycosyltransferase family 4 protein [Tepidisphaeraceae bacterium]|nr:glycosyltransferase family 4 protein [Tepidisphaeraceae bacterium]
MRITLINQFYTPDLAPTAHLCASLAEHRAAQGDDVTVITGRGGYVAPAEHDNHSQGPVKVIRVWTAQLGSKTKLRRLLDWATFYLVAMGRAVMLPRQDVIVAMTTPPYIAWAGVLQKLLHPSTRLVLWNMDCYPDAAERTNIIRKGGLVSRAMRMLNRMLFRRIDHLVCLDPAMVDLLISQYVPRKRQLPWTIIPNFERADFFPKDQEAPPCDDPVVRSLSGKFVVLYLGNTGYGHEFETMMDAAEQLRSEPVVCLLVGGGARWKWIEQERERRKLDNVILHDYVKKELTPSVMKAADCALITLQDFALGVMSPSKLHSNLAMGLPVIYVGPRGSNVDEAIQQFDCGLSVSRGEAQKVVEFIRELLADRDRQAQLRKNARRAFDEAYCDLRTLPQFDAIFAKLLGGRSMRAHADATTQVAPTEGSLAR